MNGYFVSVDGKLWISREGFRLIDTDLRFNPSHEVFRQYALTSEGQIYDIDNDRILEIPYVITSFRFLSGVGYAVTEDRLLIRIGRGYRGRVNLEQISIVARDIDYILEASHGDILTVIRGTSLMKIQSHSERDLLELNGNNDDREEGFHQVTAVSIEGNMPPMEDIIIVRKTAVVTTQGVCWIGPILRDCRPIQFPFEVVDALMLPQAGGKTSRTMMMVTNEGKLYTHIPIMPNSLKECDRKLVTSMGEVSPWYGLMDLKDPEHMAVGIHNRNGETFMINDAWMIVDTEIPPEFHLGSVSKVKNPLTRI